MSFSREEARGIREQIGAHGVRVDCPICGEPLEIEGPIGGVGSLGPIFHVTCFPCRHSAVVAEVSESRQLELGV